MGSKKQRPLDNSFEQPIVKSTQSNKGTPSEGAGNTNRELTSHAEASSMEAVENPISELSSRQLLSPATDDFFVASQQERSESDTNLTIHIVADETASACWLEALHILLAAQNRSKSNGSND